jgi:hypothetical protein
MRLTLVVVACAAAVASAQSTKPSVVAVPLVVDPNPSVLKFEKDLQAAFFKALDERSGALAASRAETDAAIADTKRRDFGESDEALAKLAEKAGTLYAVYASLQYTVKKQLILSGRVVRDDGKLMKTAKVEVARGSETLVGWLPSLSDQFFVELGVKGLPTFKEAAVAVKEPVVTAPVKKDPEVPPPPPPPVVDTGAGQRSVGTALLVAGGGLAVVGGIFAGVGGGIGGGAVTQSIGMMRVASSVGDAEKLATGRALTTVGFVGLGVGAATAAVGAVLLGTAPAAPVQSVSVVPMTGGGVVQFGGTF